MKLILKSCLLLSRPFWIALFLMWLIPSSYSQIANYVNNGGFEKIDAVLPLGNNNCASYWQPTDSSKYCYHLWSTSLGFPFPTAPNIPTGFQYPRKGKNLILSQFYCSPSTCSNLSIARGYPKNRLKTKLKANTVYCAKYHIVNTNNSKVGTDSYGAYFGDENLDTIKYCNQPLVYLLPQIEWSGNTITDTLSWVAISGTFIAIGSEKYMMLGNFRSNSATNTIVLNANPTPLTHDLYIDDVSLIEMDLPAYAGPDKSFLPGDSIYIGRESDIEIDESCIWYQMTSPTTSITIDTIAGIWVKPVTTTTYVVKQQLWCSGVKWDTVVVYIDAVGLPSTENYQDYISLFPVPAADFIQIDYSFASADPLFGEILIYNQLGQLVLRDKMAFKSKKAVINISNLDSGVYSMELKSTLGQTVKKRLVVSR